MCNQPAICASGRCVPAHDILFSLLWRRAAHPCLPTQLTVMALGFPANQGGVLMYADRRGADEVLSAVQALHALCPWCASRLRIALY